MEAKYHLDIVYIIQAFSTKRHFLFVLSFILLSFRPVFDVHETLNITVFDEDRRGAPEFLGRVGIPLLSVSYLYALLAWNFLKYAIQDNIISE